MKETAQNLDQPVVEVPGPIAVALMTGRPEMARIGIATMGDTLTPEHVKQISDYAERLVREVQAEREIVHEMYVQIQSAAQNVAGVLGVFERIEAAFRLMRDNAGPEAVRQALANPRAKRKAVTDE